MWRKSLALACLRCGERFEVLPQGPSAHCPYCGADQPLPAGLRPGLLQYQGQVARQLHDANQAYQTAAAWQEPGKYDPKFLIRGTLDALSVQVRGYPALVRWQHSTAQGGSEFLHVLLAAEVDPELVSSDGWHAPPLIQRALARCRQLGFTVRATEAGLFAAAHPQLLAQLERYPATLVPSVAPLFDPLQAIVVAMGALPARPLPAHPRGSGH